MSATAIRRGFVDSRDGGQLHYRESGTGDPVLLLHLNSGTSTMFLPIMPLLAQKYRAIALDHPGYGDSDRPAEPFTVMRQWSQTAIDLLDRLGIEKAHIVGHMTGANIAADIAAEWPERVDRLVLSEVFNWNTPPRREAHERLHQVFEPSDDISCLEPLWKRSIALSQREGVPTNWVNLGYQFLACVRVNLNNWIDREGAAKAYGVMGWDGATPYAMCRQEVKEAMARIVAPTLVMHGDKSILFRSHNSMVDSVPGATGHIIPGGDFVSPLVDPEDWAGLVLRFLDNTWA